jgi:flagellar protein FliL
MADENEEMQVEQPEKENEEAPAAGAGFSIGKLIEWLLSNMIPVIVAVVLSTIIAVIIVKASSTGRAAADEKYKTLTLQPKAEPLTTLNLDEFVLNTADIDEPHYLRVELSLAYEGENNKKLAAELPKRKEQIRDIILKILSQKEKQDIDEQFERDRVKDEIKKEINNILRDGSVEEIYIRKFIIS